MITLPKFKLPERVPREPDPPGVKIPQALPDGAKAASWIAYFALMWFLWIRVLDVSQAQFGTLQFTHFGAWVGTLALYFPIIIGYCFVVVGVPYVAKIAIPILVSLSWREHPYPKGWALFITLLVSVVLITATATVGSNALIESQRGQAVATAQVRQQAAVLTGQITAKETELKSMMENKNAYLAQAASVGEKEWQRSYIAQADRNDPQRDRVVRALGAARAADSVRSDLAGLRAQAATQTVAESVSADVKSSKTDALSAILGPLNAFWVLLLAMVMDIVCLLMPWIAMRLQQTRDRQLAEAGPRPIDESMMITDHSAEERQEVQPSLRMGKMVDAETGEELIHVRGSKPHVRVKGKKKNGRQEAQVDVPPETLPDERGFVVATDPRAAANNADAIEEEARAGRADEVELGDGKATELASVSPGHDGRGGEDTAGSLGDDRVSDEAREDRPDDGWRAAGLDVGREDLAGREALNEPFREVGEGVEADGAQPILASEDSGTAIETDPPEAVQVAEAEPLPAPEIVLDDAEIVRLKEQGVIDEDGYFQSQEDAASIEQPDEAPRYPALAPPVKEEAA